MELRKFGDYNIIEKIGEGSFGKVFKASKIANDSIEYFAIKAVAKKKLVSKQGEYFRRELAIIKRISHENIIKFYEHLENTQYHFIVMELANGKDLGELNKLYHKKHKSYLPEKFIQYISKQICSAFYYLYKQNIIHRDIKLENILFKFPDEKSKRDLDIFSGTVKIIDFGLARPTSNNDIMSSIVGSPITMAPQILQNVNERTDTNFSYDYRTDLWSIGTIIYQIVNNDFPFNANCLDVLRSKINKGEYYIKKSLNLSYELISLIDGLLQYDPNNRLEWNEIMNHQFFSVKNLEPLDFKKVEIKYISGDNLILNVHNSFNLLNSKRKNIYTHDSEKLLEYLKNKIFIKNEEVNLQIDENSRNLQVFEESPLKNRIDELDEEDIISNKDKESNYSKDISKLTNKVSNQKIGDLADVSHNKIEISNPDNQIDSSSKSSSSKNETSQATIIVEISKEEVEEVTEKLGNFSLIRKIKSNIDVVSVNINNILKKEQPQLQEITCSNPLQCYDLNSKNKNNNDFLKNLLCSNKNKNKKSIQFKNQIENENIKENINNINLNINKIPIILDNNKKIDKKNIVKTEIVSDKPITDNKHNNQENEEFTVKKEQTCLNRQFEIVKKFNEDQRNLVKQIKVDYDYILKNFFIPLNENTYDLEYIKIYNPIYPSSGNKMIEFNL